MSSLASGDEILKINGDSVQGKTIDQVAEMMAATTGAVEFVIKPASPLQSPASRHASCSLVSVLACRPWQRDGLMNALYLQDVAQ